MQSIVITSVISMFSAVLAAGLTAMLTRRREHEGDWRKLKHATYQEYISALSGIVDGRATAEAHRRHADAVNSLLLVAPEEVLSARDTYLAATASGRPAISRAEHDRLLNALLRALRQDIHPKARVSAEYHFFLRAPPSDPPSRAL
jgi:hypothetical protein